MTQRYEKSVFVLDTLELYVYKAEFSPFSVADQSTAIFSIYLFVKQ